MDFLDKIVLPQSAERIQLLHYLVILIQFLFLTFLSIVLIGTFLSLKYWKKGMKEKNPLYFQFSKDVIETLTVNKSFGVVLGILPIITSILIYAQLLHKSNSSTMIIPVIALPLSALGLILVYTFRYSLSFTDLFNYLNSTSSLEQNLKDRLEKFEAGSNKLARKSGIAGIAFLSVGAWYYVSAIPFAVFSESWGSKNQLSVLFSIPAIFNFIQFLLLAFAISGSAILFAFFYWEGGKEHLTTEYQNLIRKISLKMILASLIILPILMLINILLLPKSALSGPVFGYSVIAIALIFLSYHFLYAIVKTSNIKMSGQLFFVMIFASLALIIKDQIAVSNSIKLHSALLSSDFEKYLLELKGEGTTTVKVRSGEEIYQIICSSCHKFDEKLVGPPYNKVLTKYEGKMDQLVAFIRNPVKVDPAFPPMPNQGLKLDEAKNIAQYIMEQHMKSAAPK
jgi:cytochrome c